MIKLSEIEKKKSITTKTIYNILRKHGVKCFLTGGSLLGAYRDGGRLPCAEYRGGNFICLESDLQNKYNLIKADLQKIGYYCKTSHKGRTFAVLAGSKTGIGCEIIGYFKHGNNYVRLTKYMKVIPEKFIENPYTEIELLNEKYPAPYDIEKFLNYIYTNWKIKDNSAVEIGMKSNNHIRPRKEFKK